MKKITKLALALELKIEKKIAKRNTKYETLRKTRKRTKEEEEFCMDMYLIKNLREVLSDFKVSLKRVNSPRRISLSVFTNLAL